MYCQLVLNQPDLLRIIQDFLPIKDVSQVSRVSKVWNEAFHGIQHAKIALNTIQIKLIQNNVYLSDVKKQNLFNRINTIVGWQLGCDYLICIERCHNLKIIDFSYDSYHPRRTILRDFGFRLIATKFPDSVEILDLTNNRLGVYGIEAFSSSIPKNLRYLDLSSNFLKSEEVIILAVKFKTHKSIIGINLENNCIDDSAASALADLWVEGTLKYLNISRNQISNIGIEILKNAHTFKKGSFEYFNQKNPILLFF